MLTEKENPKVEKLVEDNELETYVIFTDYQVPPDQARNLEHYFKEAGAKLVEVIGYEVLCSWVSGSPDLKDAKRISTSYFQTKPDHRHLTAQNLNKT